MEKEISEGNKLIAEFMGGVCSNYADGSKGWIIPNLTKNGVEGDEKSLKFHSSWDWLMPVVEKIGKTIIPKDWLKAGWDLSVHYSIHSVGVSFEIGDHDLHITDSGIEAKMWDNISKEPITRTWLAVIEFIKWYNENKK